MADSLFSWGVPKIYKYGINVQTMKRIGVNDKVNIKMEHKLIWIRSSQTVKEEKKGCFSVDYRSLGDGVTLAGLDNAVEMTNAELLPF